MFRVVKKLKGLTKPIRKLMYDKGNLHSNVIRLREELDKVQTDLDSDPSNFSLREKKAVTVADFNEALLMEEKFLKQKAKITWLKERDSNTAYFPKVVKSRVSRSRIDVVTDAYGNVHQCISDNILLTQEIMHNYHLDRGVPRCAFKVDIQKAYDTVYWDFLRVTLIGFGFYERMIAWIMECVTTTSFSISINGSLHGYFEGKRGLRQGDPLSPYLFTLIMEVFTLMLKRRVSDTSTFTYHRFCSKLDLINLCFADNLFLFAHGDVNSAKVIKDTLDEFKDASGLNPSMPKSKAYFCNVINNTKLAILNILPFEEDRLPVKYLGVPLVSSRLISLDCKELIDKASVFMLPSRVLLDIEQIMRGFLWSQDNTSRGKVKVAWDVVCLLKQEGGLGIRRLDHFNKALMVSHVWKLLSLKESLWVKWIHVYKLKNRRFWDILYREWRCRDGMGKPFSVHNVWDSIRPRDNLVPCCDLVWFHACISRHAFNMWLILKQRLRTQDCLRSWENAGLTGAGPSLATIIPHLLPIAKRRSSMSCIGFLCFLSLRSGMKRRVEMADGELLLREVAERMNKRTEEGMTQSHLVSSTVPLPPHQSNVDDAAIFGVSLTTVGDLEVLIKDIDDGKHEELLYGMTNYKRKIVMVTPPNGVAAKYKSGG
nr:putative reverse transcriptase domain, reverse transcriptase zinc-binding domain protein [Tanacetum cinerariifolium]